MDANRSAYLAAKTDFESFVDQVISALAVIEPGMATLKAKDCTFRLNRDIRFSKDKSPYKTNMGASFAKGGKKGIFAGYYFHLEPGKSFVGGGLWMPMAPELKKVRQEIDYNYEIFRGILRNKAFIRHYGGLQSSDDQLLTRPPRGYTEDNPAIEWIKRKSFVAIKPLDNKMVTGKTLPKESIAAFSALQPLIHFLNTAME